MVSSNFQERFKFERKLERTRTRVKLIFLLPLHRFFDAKFTISDLRSKYVFYPNDTNRESSTKILKFYDPTDSEHKLHKTRIENWLSIGFELEAP